MSLKDLIELLLTLGTYNSMELELMQICKYAYLLRSVLYIVNCEYSLNHVPHYASAVYMYTLSLYIYYCSVLIHTFIFF